MTDADWDVEYAKSMGVFLNGRAIPDPDSQGRPVVDDSFYLIFNGWDQEIDFTLPEARWAPGWTVVLDSLGRAAGHAEQGQGRPRAGGVLQVSGHRMLVLEAATVLPNQE
jgi:glycogen operon protein